ncbi:MAG: hypothetical protein LAP13_17965 [Acidobacteriia bacterium]|nr:hypothetical protein [Terriglobia bacterium]
MLIFPPCFFILPYIPDRKTHARACEDLNVHEEVEAGCFLTGHPRIHEPVGSATLAFGEERVYLFGHGAAPLGSVRYAAICAVTVESHEAVKQRFNETRLLRLGTHLMSFRARETADGSYVIVEWEDDAPEAQRHDGIFCFEGLAADRRARHLCDSILHHAACFRRFTGARLQTSFVEILTAFETRRCEHCGKSLRPAVHKAAA